MSLLRIAIVVCAISVLLFGTRRTKRCGRTMIKPSASCAREGAQLAKVAALCWAVVNGPDIHETPMAARIRDRWDGAVHQMHDTLGAPAITTHKTDIQLCTERASSLDAQVYVCLHELAHIGVSSVGHTPEFWTCFRALIDQAVRMGVYTHDANGSVCGTRIGPVPERNTG